MPPQPDSSAEDQQPGSEDPQPAGPPAKKAPRPTRTPTKPTNNLPFVVPWTVPLRATRAPETPVPWGIPEGTGAAPETPAPGTTSKAYMAQDESAVMDIIEAKRRDEWSFSHVMKYSSMRSRQWDIGGGTSSACRSSERR